MPKRIECPHCNQADWVTALDPHDYEDDVEPCKQGFTHWCTYCLNMNWDDDADIAGADELFHFTVTDDGTVLKAPRPKGLRVEIDEAEMAITDNVHKIAEMMGRAGAAIAKGVQGLADAAFASGATAESMKAFGLACHSAGIGKTVEVDVGGDNTYEIAVIAGEAIEIGQMVYLDDSGTARVMTAAEDDDAPSIHETYTDAPLLNQHLFDDVIEAARLKAGGIPTEGGFKEKDEAQASRTSRAAVWLLKAGTASGAGAAIVWAVKQLLKGAL